MSATDPSSSNDPTKDKRDLRCNDFPDLSGDDDAARHKYLTDVYTYAVRKANGAIEWYVVNKKSKKYGAQAMRFAAIVLTTLGGITPLIVALLPECATDYAQIGFIFLALAAGCVGLDKYFGFSSAWIRYLTTAMTLQKLLQEFYLDWAALTACKDALPPNPCEAKLKRIQTFLASVYGELEKETADWAAEYRSNLAELEKSARQQLEASRKTP